MATVEKEQHGGKKVEKLSQSSAQTKTKKNEVELSAAQIQFYHLILSAKKQES